MITMMLMMMVIQVMMIMNIMMIKIMIIIDDVGDDDDNDDDDGELAHGWRPPRGGERAQRDTAPKVIVAVFAEIQNWGRCR